MPEVFRLNPTRLNRKFDGACFHDLVSNFSNAFTSASAACSSRCRRFERHGGFFVKGFRRVQAAGSGWRKVVLVSLYLILGHPKLPRELVDLGLQRR